MIIDTYQSGAVMRILQRGEVYWAKPSISFKGEYAALIDMLGLHCECPIFRRRARGASRTQAAAFPARCASGSTMPKELAAHGIAAGRFYEQFQIHEPEGLPDDYFRLGGRGIRRCTSA